jgi:hypothetical protein
MTTLPRTLDDIEKKEVFAFFRGPFGLRLLELLLEAREEFLVQELARSIADPQILEGAILDTVRPVRVEKEHIEYAKNFVRAVYAASEPAQ